MNLVMALERACDGGLLDGLEVFMFTDNLVAERAYFRGTASTRLLFDLILRLKLIESRGGCILHLIHVAGTRMISSGVDGLSRGDTTSGVMGGQSLKSFVPTHLDAVKREPKLRQWLAGWAVDADRCPGHFLQPTEWESVHQREKCYIWTPAPAAAPAAIKAMANSIHRQSCAAHVVLVPRLMTAWWQQKI